MCNLRHPMGLRHPGFGVYCRLSQSSLTLQTIFSHPTYLTLSCRIQWIWRDTGASDARKSPWGPAMQCSAVNVFSKSELQSFCIWVPTISRLLKIICLCCKMPYKRASILQKRPIILRSLLIVATPYSIESRDKFENIYLHIHIYVYIYEYTYTCI